MPQKGLKMGSFQPLVDPKWSRMRFGKMRLRPTFDAFLLPRQHILKAFWDFGRTKMGHHRLTRTDWAQHAYQWQETATSRELWLCARLLIPLSLVNAIPTTERHKLQTQFGLFQLRTIQAVQTLRQKLADPTPHQPPSPLWLTKFVAHHCLREKHHKTYATTSGRPCGAARNENVGPRPQRRSLWTPTNGFLMRVLRTTTMRWHG